MKKVADDSRREVQFAVGDWVYLKIRPYRQRTLARRVNEKLAVRFYGPYKVEARVGTVAYKLKLSTSSKIHNIFHVSLLKKCVGEHMVGVPLPAHMAPDYTMIMEPEAIRQERIEMKKEKSGNRGEHISLYTTLFQLYPSLWSCKKNPLPHYLSAQNFLNSNGFGLLVCKLVAGNALNCLFTAPSGFPRYLDFGVTHFTGGTVKSCKQEGFVIDERGKLTRFSRKKLSRRRCGSLRGRGWKYGSGFVDGIFPVLSPIAHKILSFIHKETDSEKVAHVLGTLPSTHASWDDLINVAVQLRLNKKWDSIILVCEWILRRSSFQPDVICFNLLIDAYGQKFRYKEAESLYVQLLESRCVPTEYTYALLIKAYSMASLIEKAEAVLIEMQNHHVSPSATVYNSYIEGLMKRKGNTEEANDVFQRMKRDRCKPTTETYNLMINLYGKASKSYMSWKLFCEMRSHQCIPNICTYTALVNAFAREGLCEKAEEIFEQLQEDGLEPDVYVYNALMEAYSRAGYPYGAAEIFSLMQHMGCEPDRASYNIMVDAYGRAGLHSDAEAVFEEMKRLGIVPTMKSHMLLLSAYSRARDVTKCQGLVKEMRENGVEPDTFVLNSMLNLYGRLGQFTKMEKTLAEMETMDISTYNILINVYGKAGFLERVEELFGELKERNLRADVVTWTSRIGAYSRKKLYVKCLEIFEEMIDSGCAPDGGTAKVLLSACSSEDQVEQVTSVLRTMHKDATLTSLVPQS